MSKEKPPCASKARVLRRIGPFEGYQNALHVAGIYRNTNITCRYSIPQHLTDPSRHPELVDFVELAIASCILQHPLMQVGLLNAATRKPSWIELDSIDLAKHVRWRVVSESEIYGSVLDDIVTEDLASGYSDLETVPGWRIVVSREIAGNFFDLMLFWNHPNADGTGGKIFHKTMLHHLNTPSLKPALRGRVLKTTASKENLPPQIEAVAQFTTSLAFAAQTVWKELKPPTLTRKLPTHASWAPVCVSPYKTQRRGFLIANDTLKRVLSACRVHGTTLTGLLHAISLISLTLQLPTDKAAAMVTCTALNLRPHIEPKPLRFPGFVPDETMANYVSMMDHDHDKSVLSTIRELSKGSPSDSVPSNAMEDAMWSVSKTVRQEIAHRLKLGFKDEIIGLMKVVPDWMKYVRDQLKKPRAHTFLVSNLGVLDGIPEVERGSDEDCSFSIQRGSFALSCAVFGPAFSIAAISVKGSELSVNVTWQDCVVEATMGERLVADIETWLKHVGSASNT